MTAPSLLDELEGVALLADKATPGEWFSQGSDPAEGVDCFWLMSQQAGKAIAEEVGSVNGSQWDETQRASAELIAHAVNFIRIHHAEIAESLADAAKWKKVEAVVAMAEDESDGQINTACGLLLIDRAASMNAGKLELKFSGVTGENDAELGDWIVTVKKSIDAHNSAREDGE